MEEKKLISRTESVFNTRIFSGMQSESQECFMLTTRERSNYKSDLNSPESTVTFRDRLILQHSHAGLQPEFLLLGTDSQFLLQLHGR